MCVVKDGEYKLARYCQWDGYPEGQGAGILEFLTKDFNREQFLAGLANVKEITETQLKRLWVECGADPDPDSRWVSLSVSNKFSETYPELSHDSNQYIILKGIQNGTVRWKKSDLNFAADSLFCEWCYVIDLDKNTFEIFKGFNQKPLPAGERFANLPIKSDRKDPYYQVRLVKKYSLRRLPSLKTFLKDTKSRE